MNKAIYKKIKENDIIILARHIGPDPDALGSTIGLKDIIKATFPKKEVYTIGAAASKFKYIGTVDKVSEDIFPKALLIVLDTPDLKRIDGVKDISVFKDVIKIDHHPVCVFFRNHPKIMHKDGCCYSDARGGLCENLKNHRCQIKSISCKLYSCEYLRNKKVYFKIKDIPLLKYFFNLKQKYILKYSFFKPKSYVMYKLMEN